MFVYGSLLFPDVLRTLVDRDPTREPVTVTGWRVAALPDRVYPSLVPAPDGKAGGDLFVDLTEAEWRTLDAFEAEHYYLARVEPTTGPHTHAWAYAANDPGQVAPETWSPETFQDAHLVDYLVRCTAWRQRHETSD